MTALARAGSKLVETKSPGDPMVALDTYDTVSLLSRFSSITSAVKGCDCLGFGENILGAAGQQLDP